MKKQFLILFIIAFASIIAKAQATKLNSIDVSIGLGLGSPYDDVDLIATGFYVQGEYVHRFSSWVDVRPYLGLILAKSKPEDNPFRQSFNELKSNAVLLGGKSRIKAPIPWFAPYIELGVGASIGSLKTITPFTRIEKNGINLHIPFSFGVQLGAKHDIDLAFTYYFHPDAKQYSGAFAIGASIPLKKNP